MPTLEQVQRLLSAAEAVDPDLAAFVALAAVTGARRGELCALKWSDIDVERAVIRIRQSLDWPGGVVAWTLKPTETHQTRSVSLDELALAVVAHHRRRSEARCRAAGAQLAAEAFVFSTDVESRVPLRPDSVTQAVGRICRSHGMPEVHLHTLRHWMVTTSLVGGTDVRTVAGPAGHRDASMTLRVYAHALEQADRDAAVRLGRVLAGEGEAAALETAQVGKASTA